MKLGGACLAVALCLSACTGRSPGSSTHPESRGFALESSDRSDQAGRPGKCNPAEHGRAGKDCPADAGRDAVADIGPDLPGADAQICLPVYLKCGDGRLDTAAGELCDTAGNTADCDSDCTPAVCGDGFVNGAAGEQCDPGHPTWFCDNDCTISRCEDGTYNPLNGEECDGGGVQIRGCEVGCRATACGDGILNTLSDEACDDGNSFSGDGCSATCALEL